MKILAAAYHHRTWLNILPVAEELQRRGHEVICSYIYWGKPDNYGFEHLLIEKGFQTITSPWRINPVENRLVMADILWKGDFDAILVAEEGQSPDCYWYGLAQALRSGKRQRHIPVYAMQHGYAQDWEHIPHRLNADFFLCWGPYVLGRVNNDPRFIVTGNPRFDSYYVQDAVDDGYTLIIAWPGQLDEEWVDNLAKHGTIHTMAGKYIIKIHPDDTKDYSGLMRDNVDIVSSPADTQELIRRASRVMTGPSTCALEAALYGKEVIPIDWKSNHIVPMPDNVRCLLYIWGGMNGVQTSATRRVADRIEEAGHA